MSGQWAFGVLAIEVVQINGKNIDIPQGV